MPGLFFAEYARECAKTREFSTVGFRPIFVPFFFSLFFSELLELKSRPSPFSPYLKELDLSDALPLGPLKRPELPLFSLGQPIANTIRFPHPSRGINRTGSLYDVSGKCGSLPSCEGLFRPPMVTRRWSLPQRARKCHPCCPFLLKDICLFLVGGQWALPFIHEKSCCIFPFPFGLFLAQGLNKAGSPNQNGSVISLLFFFTYVDRSNLPSNFPYQGDTFSSTKNSNPLPFPLGKAP